MKFIKEHIKLPWNWYLVTHNPNFTIDFIEEHPDYDWVGLNFLVVIRLPWNFWKAHPKYPWNWTALSINKKFTIEFIEAHLNYPWEWDYISYNKTATLDFIDSHSNYHWDWYRLQEILILQRIH